MLRSFIAFFAIFVLVSPFLSIAQQTASTTLSLSICGNEIVDVGEECDVLGETGVYSQTIAGRQCTAQCFFGPYCGDGILQTSFGEECDDGNNTNGDFCSAICEIEPAGSGGGGSSGGGGGGSGGSPRPQGDTVITVTGTAYPSRTVNFILDGRNVGTVQASAAGAFTFSTEASPGTATLGIWSTDTSNTRSVTLTNTFDVTQGAVTNLNSVILPPSIRVSQANFDPGAVLTVSGQAAPNATVNLFLDQNVATPVASTQASQNGQWSVNYNTSSLRPAEYTLRARSVSGNPPLTTQSAFSSSVKLFAGVEGRATTPSDLSRDGRINLTDFSILIFWWNTNGGDSDPPVDINGNGRVGLEDFSILLFNWTG
jgi:cysteine-rich repeat protein